MLHKYKMAGVTNGAQYAIDTLQRNVSSDNFVRNRGNNTDVSISANSLTVSAIGGVSLPSAVIDSITSVAVNFPASGAATTLYDFAPPQLNAVDFPIDSIVYVDLHDGLGVLASCALGVGAGNVPTVGSQSAVFSEAGVTAATFSVAGTSLQLAITGKTVASTGTVRLCRTG
jgi:hypothetical protein